MHTAAELEQRLRALQDARWRGVREVTVEGKRVRYGSDAEMATAIADLENRLSRVQGGRRRRVLRAYAVKDL